MIFRKFTSTTINYKVTVTVTKHEQQEENQ